MSDQNISRRFFITATAMAGFTIALDWSGINALAAKIKSKKDYPVVVIGAGLGGLSCGVLLAKKGFPVTVVEQHSIPGGYATSFERAGGKYTFDVSLHRTSADGSKLQLLRELGVLEKIELVKIPNITRLITPTRVIRNSSSPDDKEHYLCKKFPQEKNGIKKYFAQLQGVNDEMQSLINAKERGNFPARYPKLWSMRDKTLAAFVDDYVKDPDLKESLTSGWQSYGLPPSRLSAFLFVIARASRNDPYYIKTRSQALSDALAEVIEESGGNIIYETMIDKILVKNKAVSGVVTAQGKHLPAKIIISNASALTTLNKMLPPQTLAPDYIKKINSYRASISSFIVWLGLNRDISQTIKDSKITISSGRGSEADYLSCLKGEVEKLSPSVVIYDNYYKGYSKPGTSTLTIITMCGYRPWQRFESDYKACLKEAYHKEKERWAHILMQQVEEKAIPGLSSMVEVKEVATPLTNWHYTRNPGGAIYGFEQSVDNAFMNRIKNRIPLKGLYLAGAWGNPGGGYSGALRGGQRTFAQVVEDWA